jgi:malonyl-CoA O-methyltransferase
MSTPNVQTSPINLAQRRRFRNRSAARQTEIAFFIDEIAGRMFERLNYIKHEPQVILDLNCGLGAMSTTLAKRFPKAQVIPCDTAIALLQRQSPTKTLPQKMLTWFGKSSTRVCGEASALPLAAKSVDLAWSNLFALSYDAPAIIRELKRILKPGGLLMISTVGPDTLKELRAAFAQIDTLPHIQPQVDMHDLGDMLAHEGFATPVVDMEMITLTYPNVKTLAHDLRAAGAINLEPGRRETLTGKNRWASLERCYENLRHDGRLPVTFEIIYLHAWRGVERSTVDGHQIIQFEQMKQKNL